MFSGCSLIWNRRHFGFQGMKTYLKVNLAFILKVSVTFKYFKKAPIQIFFWRYFQIFFDRYFLNNF